MLFLAVMFPGVINDDDDEMMMMMTMMMMSLSVVFSCHVPGCHQ